MGIALVAGLLAGLAGWLVSETILQAYGDILNPKVRREADAEGGRRAAQAQLISAAGTFAGLGATVGLGLGLAGGLARRSASAGVRAALVGCLLGSVAAASISLLVVPYFFKKHDPQSQDMSLPLLTLGSICSSVGAAGGLAFGIGLGGRSRWVKSLVGGLVGAALATFVYEVVGGIAFPADKTELPISQTLVTRAMLHVLVATLTAVGSALALGLSSGKRDASPAP
jgi:ABC-type transport system involved in cytochrome c biogenesis permease subunit